MFGVVPKIGLLFYIRFASPRCLRVPRTPRNEHAACASRLIQFVSRSSATAPHNLLNSRSQVFMRRRCFVLHRLAVLPESVFPFAVCVSGRSGFSLFSSFHQHCRVWAQFAFLAMRYLFCKPSGSSCCWRSPMFVVQFGFECGIVCLQPSSLAFLVGCPTQRAADGWESARFSSSFLASGFSCSQSESTLRPPAANANR